MDAFSVDGVGIASLLLNMLVVVFQARQAAAMAQLKVYMHENFTPKQKG